MSHQRESFITQIRKRITHQRISYKVREGKVGTSQVHVPTTALKNVGFRKIQKQASFEVIRHERFQR